MKLLRHTATWLLLPLLAGSLVAACSNPLDIDTFRRVTTVDIDSVVSSEPFFGAPGDSIFANVNGQQVVFATEPLRPVFYNGFVDSAHYVTIQATRYGLNALDYEAMSLRLDAIRDTGTYPINAPYSLPKSIDPTSPRRYGALYEHHVNGSAPEAFRTGGEGTSGEIRVVKIDAERGVMVGTFWFTGYNTELDSVVRVDGGAFRLQLKK